MLGVDYYDEYRYKIVDETHLIQERMKLLNPVEEVKDESKAVQIHSMTDEITIYHVPSTALKVTKVSSTPSCVNIIDSPGLGDTRGPNKDAKIEKMIA